LAHLLHDGPGVKQVFLFAVLYYAMWSVWTAFTLYANVSGALTRLLPMLAAMVGIAVMAASVPQAARGESTIFILAYVWCRLLAASSWKRTSRLMTEWPGVQQAVGVLPWVASLGFEPPSGSPCGTAPTPLPRTGCGSSRCASPCRRIT
jgi:low temperature requirement protein LtrA